MNITLSILISIFSFFVQDQDIVSYKADCVNMTEEGVVTLRIWLINYGKKYKIEQAEKDAVTYILYEGFSGGKCEYISPLLKTYELKYEFEDTHMFFFRKSGDYDKYVVSSKISEVKPKHVKDESWSVYEIEINKKLLDEYLVKKEIKSKIDTY